MSSTLERPEVIQRISYDIPGCRCRNGSATGEGGFLACWEQHAAVGGNTVKFRSKEPADDHVLILELAGSAASAHDVLLVEQR